MYPVGALAIIIYKNGIKNVHLARGLPLKFLICSPEDVSETYHVLNNFQGMHAKQAQV